MEGREKEDVNGEGESGGEEERRRGREEERKRGREEERRRGRDEERKRGEGKRAALCLAVDAYCCCCFLVVVSFPPILPSEIRLLFVYTSQSNYRSFVQMHLYTSLDAVLF